MELLFIKSNAEQWVGAIVKQGHRLLNTKTTQSPMELDQKKSAEPIEDLKNWVRTEEHFFIIAVGKAMDWLEELKSANTSDLLHIDDFFKKLPNAREMRNMREHDNEYLRGKGHKQKNFHQEVKVKVKGISGGGRISADATATVIIGNDYLLGGRLNVQETIMAAEQLQKILMANKLDRVVTCGN
jgi:hypothetical protein